MGRSPCCDKAAVKRGPWTAEEDARLRSYIQEHGTGGNWIALPRKVGLRRCGKSCRLRWLNYLRPDIRHGGFSDDEDRLIFALYAAIGSRWSVIAAHLPGRTDNDVKNYWNTRLKKRLLFANAAGKPPPLDITSPSVLQLHDGDHCGLPLPHANNQLYVASTSSGSVTVHVGVGEGRTSSSTALASHSCDVFAAGQSSTAAMSYSSGATVAMELDEIFRSTSTSGGNGDCSSSAQTQSTDAMMMNWYNNQLQLQGELQGLQQQLGSGMPYCLLPDSPIPILALLPSTHSATPPSSSPFGRTNRGPAFKSSPPPPKILIAPTSTVVFSWCRCPAAPRRYVLVKPAAGATAFPPSHRSTPSLDGASQPPPLSSRGATAISSTAISSLLVCYYLSASPQPRRCAGYMLVWDVNCDPQGSKLALW